MCPPLPSFPALFAFADVYRDTSQHSSFKGHEHATIFPEQPRAAPDWASISRNANAKAATRLRGADIASCAIAIGIASRIIVAVVVR